MFFGLISKAMTLVIGVLYPAYYSHKAIRENDVTESNNWIMYWIVFAIYICAESVADIFISWVPFYYETKILFVLYLTLPVIRGSTSIYQNLLLPILSRKEPDIDACIANAMEKTYSTFLEVGLRSLQCGSRMFMVVITKLMSNITSNFTQNPLLEDGMNSRASQMNINANGNGPDFVADSCARSRPASRNTSKPSENIFEPDE